LRPALPRKAIMNAHAATLEAVSDVDGQAQAGPAQTVASDVQVATEVIAADLLVEEISIDGMCGVY
jgi:mycofactocin precursor